MSLGFEQAGFDIVASVEYDPVHAAVHAFNFPLTEVVCADASTLSASDLLAAAARGFTRHNGVDWPSTGDVDVVFAGPPCQGYSTMGKRLIDDERNRLVFHFLRLVLEIRPRYFVMENVPGMKAGGHASILEALIADFTESTYRVVRPVEVLNAADYGVPQDRRRLILLGAREDQPLPSYPDGTVEPATKRRAHRPSLRLDCELPAGPTVWDAIGDIPDLDHYSSLIDDDQIRLTDAQLKEAENKASAFARRLLELDADPHDYSHRREWDRRVLTSSLRTLHTPRSVARFKDTASGEVEPISRFYRLAKYGLCNTLRSGTGSERGAFTSPRPIHPTKPRVISVREAARLHSYPDWFRFHKTKWHGFRQIGNSVPPLLGRAIGQAIMFALRITPTKPRGVIPLGDAELLSIDRLTAAKRLGADLTSIPQSRTRERELAVVG